MKLTPKKLTPESLLSSLEEAMSAPDAPTIEQLRVEAMGGLHWRLECPLSMEESERRVALEALASLEPARQFAFWAVEAAGRSLVQRWGDAADVLSILHDEALERAQRAERIEASREHYYYDDDEFEDIKYTPEAVFGLEDDDDD